MMELHLHKDDFTILIRRAAEHSGISADIIEKDYFVTLMLEHSSKKFTSLPSDTENAANENRKGSITQIYQYDSCFDVPADPLQRYEKVKVEATSFTISEPTEKNWIHPLLVDALPEDIAESVVSEYGLQDFQIENISLERIFCDKLLAAEFYIQREEYFDVAKHLYDIVTMMEMPRIQRMFKDEKAFINYLSYKRIEETLRIGSDLSHKPFSEFLLFDMIFNNQKFEASFEDMQRKYIFQDEYRKGIQDVKRAMTALKEKLLEIDPIEQINLRSKEFMDRVAEYNPEYVDKLDDEGITELEKKPVCRKRGR